MDGKACAGWSLEANITAAIVATLLALLRPSPTELEWKLTDLAKLASELQGSSCLCPPRAGVVGKPHHVLLFACMLNIHSDIHNKFKACTGYMGLCLKKASEKVGAHGSTHGNGVFAELY